MRKADEMNLVDNAILRFCVAEFISRNKKASRELLRAKAVLCAVCLMAFRILASPFLVGSSVCKVWAILILASIVTSYAIWQVAHMYSPSDTDSHEQDDNELIEFASVVGFEGGGGKFWDMAKRTHYMIVEKRFLNASCYCLGITTVVFCFACSLVK